MARLPISHAKITIAVSIDCPWVCPRGSISPGINIEYWRRIGQIAPFDVEFHFLKTNRIANISTMLLEARCKNTIVPIYLLVSKGFQKTALS